MLVYMYAHLYSVRVLIPYHRCTKSYLILGKLVLLAQMFKYNPQYLWIICSIALVCDSDIFFTDWMIAGCRYLRSVLFGSVSFPSPSYLHPLWPTFIPPSTANTAFVSTGENRKIFNMHSSSSLSSPVLLLFPNVISCSTRICVQLCYSEACFCWSWSIGRQQCLHPLVKSVCVQWQITCTDLGKDMYGCCVL